MFCADQFTVEPFGFEVGDFQGTFRLLDQGQVIRVNRFLLIACDG
jgi:hypothetical protein